MIILDTHAFVWLASDPDQFSKSAWKSLQATDATLAISIVSAWEIAILNRKGRLQLPIPANTFISRAIARHRIRELPLTREVIFHAVQLPEIHRDPFDRILIAEAQIHKVPLISKDRNLPEYPDVQIIW